MSAADHTPNVIKDHSKQPCLGCNQYQLFEPARSMAKGTIVDYVWRCPVCHERSHVTGVAPSPLEGKPIRRWLWSA